VAKRNAATRRLDALLRRLEPKAARKLVRAFNGLRASLSQDRVERAVASRSEFAIRDLTGTLPKRLASTTPDIKRAFDGGLDVGRAALGVTFTGVDRFSVKAARETAAQFVTGVTEETRAAVRAIVVESFTQGVSPRDTAARIREVVGLTARQSRAVLQHRSTLLREGASRSAAGKSARRYAERLIGKRATTIARTEIMRASNAGQRASWSAAVADGHLSARSRKLWIVAPDDRLCPYCEPMDGVAVGLDLKFDTGLGQVDGPPLHPNCRCTLGIRPAEATGRRSAAA
jgi:hypothetical protein